MALEAALTRVPGGPPLCHLTASCCPARGRRWAQGGGGRARPVRMRMGAALLVCALVLSALPWAPSAARHGQRSEAAGRRRGALPWLWRTRGLQTADEELSPVLRRRQLAGPPGAAGPSLACTPSSPCAGSLAPNSAVFVSSQGAQCNCSAPLALALALANASQLAWTAPQAALLQDSVAGALQLQPAQVPARRP